MSFNRFLLPILIVFILSPFLSWIDMQLSLWIYESNNHEFYNNYFTIFFYEYGVIPGNIMASVAVLLYVFSFFLNKIKKWRKPALLLILTLALGSGFIGHELLKNRWGRPRPKQVVEFGGNQSFRPFYSPNFFQQPEPSKSFICGHCTMGFYFLALALIGKRERSPFLIGLGMSLFVILTIGLSAARLMMGGHFFSDILFAGLIMWYTILGIDWLLFPLEENHLNYI